MSKLTDEQVAWIADGVASASGSVHLAAIALAREVQTWRTLIKGGPRAECLARGDCGHSGPPPCPIAPDCYRTPGIIDLLEAMPGYCKSLRVYQSELAAVIATLREAMES